MPGRSVGECGSARENLAQRRLEKEEAQRVREAAFDAGLIGRGGEVAPGIKNVMLLDFVEPEGGTEDGIGESQRGLIVDLNLPAHMKDGDKLCVVQQAEESDGGMGDMVQTMTQDSDPFELEPIIEEACRASKRRKRRFGEIEEGFAGGG